MLMSLSVRNIALIECMTMLFHNGFHVVSGASGSGKSLVVDAVNLVLGGRADKDLIRNGAEKASVEAVFFTDNSSERINSFLNEQGIDKIDDNTITFFREITLSGRSISRINGIIVTINTVKQLAGYLIDVHGQHEHQRLSSQESQLLFLDMTGDRQHKVLMETTANKADEFLKNHRTYAHLVRQREQTKEKRELLISDLRYIRSLKIKQKEDECLAEEISFLKAKQKRRDAIIQASTVLNPNDGIDGPIVRIKEALQAFRKVEYDSNDDAGLIYRRFENCYFELEEISYEISRLLDKTDNEAEKLEIAEKRLDMLRKAERHFGTDLSEIMNMEKVMERELHEIESLDDKIETTGKDHKRLLKEYREVSTELSRSRHILAEKFSEFVCRELDMLDMSGTVFSVHFEEKQDDKPRMPKKNGDDEIEFMISPNPGEPSKPLSKVASGGELSRIMLAITGCGNDNEKVGTVIFDEIDTGISGHTAQKVAEKIKGISDSQQVICVTHLPQIAAAADHQYLITKHSAEEKTFTKAIELDRTGRIEELAAMMQGADNIDAAKLYARKMLDSYTKIVKN